MSNDFCSEKLRTARKKYFCGGCLQPIHKGEAYLSIAGKWDGDFYTAKYHKECREFEQKLNDETGMLPDEFYYLYEMIGEDRSILHDAPQVIVERFKKGGIA